MLFLTACGIRQSFPQKAVSSLHPLWRLSIRDGRVSGMPGGKISGMMIHAFIALLFTGFIFKKAVWRYGNFMMVCLVLKVWFPIYVDCQDRICEMEGDRIHTGVRVSLWWSRLESNSANYERTEKTYRVMSPDLEFSPKVSPDVKGDKGCWVQNWVSVRIFCARCGSSWQKNSKTDD